MAPLYDHYSPALIRRPTTRPPRPLPWKTQSLQTTSAIAPPMPLLSERLHPRLCCEGEWWNVSGFLMSLCHHRTLYYSWLWFRRSERCLICSFYFLMSVWRLASFMFLLDSPLSSDSKAVNFSIVSIFCSSAIFPNTNYNDLAIVVSVYSIAHV